MSEAQPKKLGIQCVFEGSADESIVFTLFPKLSRAKYVIYCVFEGSAKKKYGTCGFEGSAEQSMVLMVLLFATTQSSKV